ncbi:hypothetical protein [Photobacterium damselae]|nr:hypothetical protein [Photobacterium damselae]EHA1081396.1 hypothetical protein [Photobacterium damselae]MBA5682399.1 hypothetical protein [Photobacterium damselae subsp. damselae]MCG3813032.1 hypothetical protein [Photobacterium damselae]MCG3823664.1 hypothetical protein [Photobacterium damselae]NVH52323.1 hypothetical protein [Photobacterium damselae subsp. damselae]
MHVTDAMALVNLGVNIEITKDSSLHPIDALEIVKIATKIGTHVTVKKRYHIEVLMEIAKVGRDNITISI